MLVSLLATVFLMDSLRTMIVVIQIASALRDAAVVYGKTAPTLLPLAWMTSKVSLEEGSS